MGQLVSKFHQLFQIRNSEKASAAFLNSGRATDVPMSQKRDKVSFFQYWSRKIFEGGRRILLNLNMEERWN
jgi:hypothetical protein